ncbi:Na+/H+ antiporter NhaA [Rothia nasimurium]|uniref:Na+/H+ antiporter NhaA n=1 Tax=Rothia nasimurium TaxID=85336 RepID=UPI001ADDC84F|nr:Na+/H+ antiporter NhaA [Rothia nasimurium]
MSQESIITSNYLRKYVRRYRFLRSETNAALALALATAAALIWANFGGESYSHFWHTEAGFTIANFDLHFTFHEWVDEGLMTFFFFMVGLDVRRDIALGELRNPKQAVLPTVAALGGLAVPALIFYFMTNGSGFESAWGIVISTDTAFALGMLALIGPKNAPRLRAFLLAFAVIDDIGALSVIAIFYTDDLNPTGLFFVALGLAAIWLMARRGAWQSFPYIVIGIFTWAAMYSSGIHATLAGVLIALLMPVYAPRRSDADAASGLFNLYRQDPVPGTAMAVRQSLLYAIPLNQRLSDFLPSYVNYLVVPLFALANAGIVITGESFSAAATSSVTWGVIFGLVLGKLLGVVLGAWAVTRLMPSSRLPGLDMPRIAGIGALSGIGFTISLLVAGMAIDDEVVRDQARIGVLLASLFALILATIIFRLGDRFAPLEPPAGERLPRAIDPEKDHLYGDPNAVAQVVFYTDYSPNKVAKFAGALWQSYNELDNDSRISYTVRHKTEGALSNYLALSIEAAAAQGKFGEYHNAISHIADEVASYDESIVKELADSLGLDFVAMQERISSGIDQARIDRDNSDLPEELRESADPILYINGRRVEGPLNTWVIGNQLAEELEKAESLTS